MITQCHILKIKPCPSLNLQTPGYEWNFNFLLCPAIATVGHYTKNQKTVQNNSSVCITGLIKVTHLKQYLASLYSFFTSLGCFQVLRDSGTILKNHAGNQRFLFKL